MPSIFGENLFDDWMNDFGFDREFFGKPYTPDTLLIKTENKEASESYAIASYLSDNYNIKTWSSTSDSRESFANTMERMNYVIVLIIVSAAALAFIVLFNLNNINITERIREIATLKVMGFNRSETGAYVTRENVLLVLMGFIAGIPLGFLLHRYVMAQIAMDMVTYQVGFRCSTQCSTYSPRKLGRRVEHIMYNFSSNIFVKKVGRKVGKHLIPTFSKRVERLHMTPESDSPKNRRAALLYQDSLLVSDLYGSITSRNRRSSSSGDNSFFCILQVSCLLSS